MKLNEAYLTMLLNENGGIIDDCIATNDEEAGKVRLVVNASNKYEVIAHLIAVSRAEFHDVKINLFEDELGLVALQGPASAEVLQSFLDDVNLSDVPFMSQFTTTIKGHEATVTRSGYTGEDGFEISASAAGIVEITEGLLKDGRVMLAGLGARDSLRLEAGLCLHGNDISASTTPFEAALMWTVYKPELETGRLQFIGEEVLRRQVEDSKAKTIRVKKRVGFKMEGTGIVRGGCKVMTKEGEEVGLTTSGVYSPSLSRCVGMAYVDQECVGGGRELLVEQRNRKYEIRVEKMPFVKAKYYKGWQQLS